MIHNFDLVDIVMFKQSIDNVEELLYESFLLQNCNEFVRGFEKNQDDIKKTPAKTKKKVEKENVDLCRKTKFGKKKSKDNEMKMSNKKKRTSRTKNYSKLNCPEKKSDMPNSLDHEFQSSTSICAANSRKRNSSGAKIVKENIKSNETGDLNRNGGAKIDLTTSVLEISTELNETINLNDSVKACDGNFLETSVLDKKIWECPICLEQSKGQQIVTTICGHVFCKLCLETHCKTKDNNTMCPTCRFDLKNTKFITLYNV